MAAARCSCGFQETEDEQISDHFLEVFEPDNGIGTDGREHDEGKLLTCFCGLAAATGRELDAHFLAVFTPADSVGRDGARHTPIA